MWRKTEEIQGTIETVCNIWDDTAGLDASDRIHVESLLQFMLCVMRYLHAKPLLPCWIEFTSELLYAIALQCTELLLS